MEGRSIRGTSALCGNSPAPAGLRWPAQRGFAFIWKPAFKSYFPLDSSHWDLAWEYFQVPPNYPHACPTSPTGGACIAVMDGKKPTLHSEQVFPTFPYVLSYFMRIWGSSQKWILEFDPTYSVLSKLKKIVLGVADPFKSCFFSIYFCQKIKHSKQIQI